MSLRTRMAALGTPRLTLLAAAAALAAALGGVLLFRASSDPFCDEVGAVVMPRMEEAGWRPPKILSLKARDGATGILLIMGPDVPALSGPAGEFPSASLMRHVERRCVAPVPAEEVSAEEDRGLGRAALALVMAGLGRRADIDEVIEDAEGACRNAGGRPGSWTWSRQSRSQRELWLRCPGADAGRS